MYRIKKRLWQTILALGLVLLFGGFINQSNGSNTAWAQGIQRLVSWGGNYHSGSQQSLPPTKEQAESVLTPAVRQQLGDSISWNGSGAFIVNNNRPQLNANISSAPYAVNLRDQQGRAWRGDAWLNRTTRQYRNRNETGNGATSWRPAGFLQAQPDHPPAVGYDGELAPHRL